MRIYFAVTMFEMDPPVHLTVFNTATTVVGMYEIFCYIGFDLAEFTGDCMFKLTMHI